MNVRSDSLRWKIAAWYATLLVVVLATTSGVLVWRFGSIIYAQARERANATMDEVLAVANPVGAPLGLQDVASNTTPLQVLLNSDNLVYWTSPESAIEIDTPAGYPMVKTPNLGAGRIPPAPVDAAHPVAFRDAQVRGQPAIVAAHFVRVGGTTNVVVQVAQSLATVSHAIDEARRTVVLVLAAAIAAVVALSLVLASQAINPINELSRAMREIGFERLGRRLNWPRRDEIGALAESFDDLLARLEASFSRERQFISDASHELKTPLTSINANAQMLLRWAERNEGVRRESLETIAHESSSLGEMVNGMLTLAKADRGDDIPKEPVSLIEEAREVVRHAAPRAREKGLTLTFVPKSDSAIVFAEPHLIRQMIGNLVDNAIKFTDAGGVDVLVGAEDGTGWLEVRDTGPGIGERDLPRIFERFYRADRSRSRSVPGTGLGLAIVRSIARAHDGNVDAQRSASGGSLFRVTIPLLALLAGLFCFSPPAIARADEIAVSASPVVNVMLANGNLTITTWNRSEIRVVTDKRVDWKRFDTRQTAPRIPSEINSWAVTVSTPRGPAFLPAETFMLPAFAPGPHDAVSMQGFGDTTITVPSRAALVIARVIAGTITVRGYHGVLVAHVRRGAMRFVGFRGTAYAQVVAGRIIAVDSSFDRLRARTANGNLLFEACRSRQIDVTAIHGAILYDDGAFAEGPAYFSTGEGAVAIGVVGSGLTLSGHSANGDVMLGFGPQATVRRRGGSVVVNLGGGGAFVSAQAPGLVALYHGRLAEHRRILARLGFARFAPIASFRGSPPRSRPRGRRSSRRPPR
ncbi:MAG TPA: ATP-binding protein [Candidatus Dormibacteraeota bacterium]|nr:ATP-binding protein [Candidatus Dormibacteraeota bacterium]